MGDQVLITGGAGFIGSNLCRRLLADGHEVACLDNFCSGRRENIAELEGEKGFRLLEQDVEEELKLKPARIYHLASPASPKDFESLALEIARANSLGTTRMLELANQSSARILVASTSEIYGEPLEHPQKESYFGNVNSLGPRAPYDEGKRFAEAVSMAYHRKHKLDVRLVRIFNTYGPHMRADDGRVVTNFITQALAGKALTIYGDGKQTRSFCYVDDLVEGLVRVMESDKATGEVFNLGNEGEFTVAELAEKVNRLVGNEAECESRPLRHKDDPTRRCPDASKAKQVLGWQAKVELEDGLKKTIEWFKGRG